MSILYIVQPYSMCLSNHVSLYHMEGGSVGVHSRSTQQQAHSSQQNLGWFYRNIIFFSGNQRCELNRLYDAKLHCSGECNVLHVVAVLCSIFWYNSKFVEMSVLFLVSAWAVLWKCRFCFIWYFRQHLQWGIPFWAIGHLARVSVGYDMLQRKMIVAWRNIVDCKI